MNIIDNKIVMTEDSSFNLLREEISYKNIEQEILNFKNKSLEVYPFYLNENAYIKIFIESIENELIIKINKILRGSISELYNNSFNTSDLKIKIIQNQNTFAYYLNNDFLFMHKEKDFTFGDIRYSLKKDMILKIISFENYMPNNNWNWNLVNKNLTFLVQNKESKYAISSFKDYEDKSNFSGEINVSIGESYVLSLYDFQNLHVKINEKDITSEFLNKNYYVFVPDTDVLKITFSDIFNEDVCYLPKIQLEKGIEKTSYIENENTIKEVGQSVFKVPMKNNIDRNSGTLVYNFIPKKSQTSFYLFKIGDFILRYNDKKFILSSKNEAIPDNQIYVPYEKFDKEITIIWTWIKNNHKLIVYSNKNALSATSETGKMNGSFENMDFAYKNINESIIKFVSIYSLDFYYNKTTSEEFRMFAENNSASKMFGIDLKNEINFFKKPYLESSLAPLDGSPILLENNEGAMRRQFFFDDDTGKYRDYNVEYFEYLGQDVLSLAYDMLDETFNIQVNLKNGEIFGAPYKIIENQVFLTLSEEEKEENIGKELLVTYRLKNSYNVEFNEKAANDSYIINLDNPNGESIKVTQEGDRFNTVKLAKEIELNPILNPRHEGFLYITKNSQETKGFRINTSSDMVTANNMDSADIMVEAIDEHGNEVLSPYIDIYIINEFGKESTELGTIIPITNYETLKARSTSGRLYFKYYSPFLSKKELNREKRIYIVVYDRKNKIGSQTSLILKPTNEELKTSNILLSKSSNIVFEYISRYFEKNNINENILRLLDYDNNGQITREDLELFNNQKNKEEIMNAISLELRKMEEF